ncbi:hypothetical protein B0H14DRAFT_2641231 [Mycena olivaceomarginata]|nr:hypothetical protein B0H14DRAFT_2641231 [Mycena olivaceomarginata]
MKFNSVLFPLALVASGSVISASTTAVGTPHGVAIGGRTLVQRITTATAGTTLTVTKTVTSPKSTPTGDGSCNWCECFTAMAAEGVACAAAILEGGCNIIADISCIIDATAFAQAINEYHTGFAVGFVFVAVGNIGNESRSKDTADRESRRVSGSPHKSFDQ